MKKKLSNAIRWFDEMVHSFGIECETSAFLHNILASMLTQTLEDGCMIWDDDMVEKTYPQAVDQIKRKEREKTIIEFQWFICELRRRLEEDGK